VSQDLLCVRVADRSGALERVLGLLRRRVLAVRRLSVAACEGAFELTLRLDEARTPRERLRAELLGLVDVIDVSEGGSAPTRELAVVRLTAGGRPPDGEGWRVLSNGADGAVVEFTGSPDEVDAAVARLRGAGVLAQVTRSGEIAVPGRRAAAAPDASAPNP
jgi:acetolactate synthase small subunit